jgi:hypothetical protein
MRITIKMRNQFVRNKIATDNKWLFRAIEVIFSRQTADEQATDTTRHENGIGFNGVDAEIMSSFARQIIRWKRGEVKYNCPLSPKQLTIAKKKMPKYASQIIEVSNSEQLDKMVEASVPNPMPLDFGNEAERQLVQTEMELDK